VTDISSPLSVNKIQSAVQRELWSTPAAVNTNTNIVPFTGDGRCQGVGWTTLHTGWGEGLSRANYPLYRRNSLFPRGEEEWEQPWPHPHPVKVKIKQPHYRPWQALKVPAGWGSRILRQSAHEGGKVVSPTHWPPLQPGNSPGVISVRGWVDPRAIVRNHPPPPPSAKAMQGMELHLYPICPTWPDLGWPWPWPDTMASPG
jgi:hypothetical protein